MKKTLHILAIFLFALTQLFAPLVHAHVDGIQSDATFHVQDTPRSILHIDLTQGHIESYGSQTISIPHQYQNDDALVIADFCISTTQPLPSNVTNFSANTFDTPRITASAYRKPHAQAPPQLS